MKIKKLIAFCALNAIFLTGCSFLTPPKQDLPRIEPVEYIALTHGGAKNSTSQIKSLNELKKATDLSNLVNKYLNKKDGRDCSGFVSLINKKSQNLYFKERNLDKFYSKYGFKSEAIFNLYKSKNLIIDKEPKVGDLVFFNNTTNKTKNYKKIKVITHIGIVDKIYNDGTIRFVHHNGSKNKHGFINFDYKNRHKSGKKEINSYIINCKNKNSSCLASNRFAGFGSVKF
ncbi:NlpC/P60 family protein [Campylobacter sp.]|uniref:NlpC/P60 family protein n=1 Tax=Campylobacter sp. TaxID=205 RepID=UPI002705FF56|nr:NlpC/P60 family protein [Campylobacter sp.]